MIPFLLLGQVLVEPIPAPRAHSMGIAELALEQGLPALAKGLVQ